MFPEVQSRLFRIGEKRFLQRLPVEDINTHRRQIAARICRLLLEVSNPAVFIGNHNSEAFRFFHRNRHNCYGHLCAVLLVEIKHHFIVHLINMIPGKNQHIVRIKGLHVVDILIYRIRCTSIPFTVCTLLIGRKNCNAAYVPVQIPRYADTDMRI